MNLNCPTCGSTIDLDDVNIARDVALCRLCERTFSFAEVASDRQFPTVPPWGTWFGETSDGFVVGAAIWSPFILLMIPFVGLWSLVLLWLTIGSQIALREFLPFQSFAGLIVLLFSAFVFGQILIRIAGRVEIRVSGDEMEIFTGVGLFGLRKRLSWSGIGSVTESITRSYPTITQSIRILGEVPNTFGTLLSEPRRLYLIGTLRRQLRQRSKAKFNHFDELLSA